MWRVIELAVRFDFGGCFFFTKSVAHLRIIAVFGLVAEVEEVSFGPSSGVEVPDPNQRGDGVPVAEGLHGRIPDVDGVLYGLVPIRVLVSDGRKNLVQVVDVSVPYVGPQDAVPLLLLETVLDVGGAEVVIAFRGGGSQHNFTGNKVFAGVLHGEGRVRGVGVHRQRRGDPRHETDHLHVHVQQGLHGSAGQIDM